MREFTDQHGEAQQELKCIEHIDVLYRYALGLARDAAEAEDLVQETYLNALKAVERTEAVDNIKVWLFKILRNTWIDQLRRAQTAKNLIRPSSDEELCHLIDRHAKDSYNIYLAKVERDTVRRAIGHLPFMYREIIRLREYEDLSYREIASILDCPIGTVMSRLTRARAMLRVLLSEQSKDGNSRSGQQHLEVTP